jgi:hydrogenase maturation protein HypF
VSRLADLTGDHSTADLAATAQALLADGLARIAVDCATDRGVDAVGFTGGVAYNPAVSRRLRRTVEAAGLTVLGHEAVPPGDGGLAYGQAVAASARLARR